MRPFLGAVEVCLFKVLFRIKSMANAVLLLVLILFVTSCVQTDYNDLKPTPVDVAKQAEQAKQKDGAEAKTDASKTKASEKILIDKTAAKKIEIKKAPVKKSNKSGRIKYNASWKCVPKKLKSVIYQVSRKFGHVTVNSTSRSRRKNRRIGGAKSSWHIGCRAVDFRVTGRTRGLYRWLRRHPNVGGLKRYRSGFYHIDIGPRRSW